LIVEDDPCDRVVHCDSQGRGSMRLDPGES